MFHSLQADVNTNQEYLDYIKQLESELGYLQEELFKTSSESQTYPHFEGGYMHQHTSSMP